jgi:hypothetical protein
MNFKDIPHKNTSLSIKVIICAMAAITVFCQNTKAQEKLYPLNRNAELQNLNQPPHKVSAHHFKTQKILQIPFFDDFSTYTGYPNDTLWMDNYVYINTGSAVNPPSIGAATFDGLNSFGLAYEHGNIYSTASADTLTSAFINLSGLQAKDSVSLSFYYQAAGLSDSPDPGDSLIVEFKPDHVPSFDSAGHPILDSTKWIKVWSADATGFAPFKRAYIPVLKIADTNYFQGKFQFRFRNLANRSGNLDIWNVDYVYLDRARKKTDTFSLDVAAYQPSRGIIKGYTAIPYRHFIYDTAHYNRKNIDVYSHNNSNITRHTTFNYIIYSLTEKDTLASTISVAQAANINPNQFLDFQMPLKRLKSLIVNNLDSVVYLVQTIGKSDVTELPRYQRNDTAKRLQVFNNYFAYDDGTAENGYGITSSPNGAQVALKFRLINQDTLFGIGIHFNQSLADVSTNTVDLMVWKGINEHNTAGGKDIQLSRLADMHPVYVDKVNGFAYFALDTPVAVNDSIYIGWKQTTDFQLNVGFDRNYSQIKNPGETNLYYNIDGKWFKSKQDGIPMIRAFVGKKPVFPAAVNPVKNQENLTAEIFPNPSTGFFNISLGSDARYNVELITLNGKVLMGKTNISGKVSIDASAFEPGIYLIRIKSLSTGSQCLKKIIIY